MSTPFLAPAKIDLTLHVTGQRADGYHMLDSLVVFADVGDRITVARASRASLAVTGPFAAEVPAGPENLVLKAAELMGAPPAAITLEKNLPAASGIGGGSADAAATMRALSVLYSLDLPAPAKVAALGADVPVCLLGRACRMSGIGDVLHTLPDMPPLHLVLVNPRVPVATPDVFSKLIVKYNAAMPEMLPEWADGAKLGCLAGCAA